MFQIARSNSLRQECREAEEKVINATREKFLENQQKKIEKEIYDIDRRSNISEAVLKHGGPCLRQEDVDELEERLLTEGRCLRQITEVFKSEFRYQKHISGRKMKFGTLNFMKDSLRDCLVPRSPQAKRHKTS